MRRNLTHGLGELAPQRVRNPVKSGLRLVGLSEIIFGPLGDKAFERPTERRFRGSAEKVGTLRKHISAHADTLAALPWK